MKPPVDAGPSTTLLRHHLRRNPTHEWLDRQTYLDPYPAELMLRNHV